LADGSTFYYADYNFHGSKFYKKDTWPCCSGTLPQVAADYRINAYFSDDDGLYVNLYIPSTLRAKVNGTQVSLTQSGEYPLNSAIQFEVKLPKTTEFAIHLRIPAWADGAAVSVNGKRVESVVAGKFATVRRTWKSGDRIEMDLPMKLRLEPIDPQHAQIVALLCGPLVLFAITNAPPSITARQLLAAKRTGRSEWQVETAGGSVSMLPFTVIEDQPYSTYLTVA
jgi:hypothetical protein